MARRRPSAHLAVIGRHPRPGQEGKEGAGHEDERRVDAGKLQGRSALKDRQNEGERPISATQSRHSLPRSLQNAPPWGPRVLSYARGPLTGRRCAVGRCPDGAPQPTLMHLCMRLAAAPCRLTLVTAASAGLCWLAACSTSCAMRATVVSPAAAVVRTRRGVDPTLSVPAWTASPGRRSTGADSPASGRRGGWVRGGCSEQQQGRAGLRHSQVRWAAATVSVEATRLPLRADWNHPPPAWRRSSLHNAPSHP